MRWTSKSWSKWEHFVGSMARILCGSRNVRIGASFQCSEIPHFRVDPDCSVEIGDNVIVRKGVEFRATGRSRIVVEDNVRLDRGIRVLATNDAVVTIGEGSRIGLLTVLNGGDSITVGKKCLVSGFVYLQTSMHGHQAGAHIQDQGFDHAPVSLGDDAWLGAHVVVLPGCEIGKGAVVGSNGVVTQSVPDGAIATGVPAKVIKSRTED